MKKKISLSLTTQIGIALLLAVLAGILLSDHADFVNGYIKPVVLNLPCQGIFLLHAITPAGTTTCKIISQ